MKKHLLNLRALLMLCMIFVIGGGSLAFAEEVTVTSTFTNYKWAVNTGEPTWTKQVLMQLHLSQLVLLEVCKRP